MIRDLFYLYGFTGTCGITMDDVMADTLSATPKYFDSQLQPPIGFRRTWPVVLAQHLVLRAQIRRRI
jgi:hypothetical protein